MLYIFDQESRIKYFENVVIFVVIINIFILLIEVLV